ncbi:MAG: NUDIX hydrolase [Candidatus Bathyarchaeota archaeon]|nr:NUDIX hydrolase [Candidatus Bathyarchaeum sp.]
MEKWKLIETKLICSSSFLKVFDDKVMLPNGKHITFTKMELIDFVSVVPVTDNNIVMIEILRYPRNCLSLEIPSGHVEKGETPKDSAVRELKEETGYSAEKIECIGRFNPLSRSTQQAHLFLAKNLTKGTQQLEATEQINVKLVPIEDIKEMLNSLKITHAPTIIALQKFLLMQQETQS